MPGVQAGRSAPVVAAEALAADELSKQERKAPAEATLVLGESEPEEEASAKPNRGAARSNVEAGKAGAKRAQVAPAEAPTLDGDFVETQGSRRARSADKLATKGDVAAPREPNTVGTLGGMGTASGEREKDGLAREDLSGLNEVVSQAKAKKEAAADVERRSELALADDAEGAGADTRSRMPAPKPSAPPPPSPPATAGPSPDPQSVDRPAKQPPAAGSEADSDDGADAIGPIRTRARAMESRGDVEGARAYLLTTRRQFTGRPMYEQVSFELAEFEMRQKRYGPAEAYARDVLTTKDQALAARARQLLRRAQEAAR